MDKEEAIKILRELHDKVLFSERTALETLHPELKESEDEKIRKALVRFHKGTIDIDGIKGEDILAWLEKQGEQKSQRMISAEAKEAMYDKPTDLEVFINELSKQFPDVSFAKLSRIAVRVAKWAKPTDEEMKELLRTEYEKGRADTIAEMQKSTWSEEDEKRFKSCLNILQAKGLTGVTDTINSKWLKSIKERVQPQPKQEWSEKDEKTWKELIEEVKDQLDSVPSPDCRDKEDEKALKQLTRWLVWLKSLKERYAWKPSDAQMVAVQEAMNIVGILTITGSKINSLYQDLKKLREE